MRLEPSGNLTPPAPRLRQFLLLFLLAALLLSLIEASGVWNDYAHHDNTRYFREHNDDLNFKKQCANDNQWIMLLAFGRPLAAWLECRVWVHALDLSDLRVFKLLALLALAGAAVAFACGLMQQGYSQAAALLMGTLLMTLPGLQHVVFMTAIQSGLAVALAVGANYLLQHPLSRPWLGYSLAFVLLFGSLSGHQGLAAFFFVPTFFYLLDASLKGVALGSLVKSVARSFLFFGLVSLCYLFFAKLMIQEIPWSHAPEFPATYRVQLNLANLWSRFVLLTLDGVPTIFNPWDVYYATSLSRAVSGVVLALLTVGFLYLRSPEANFKARLLDLAIRLLLLTGVFYATFSAWLLSSWGTFAPRLMAGGSAVVALLIVRLSMEFVVWLNETSRWGLPPKRLVLGVGAVFLAYSGGWAFKIMSDSVANNVHESNYITAVMKQGLQQQIRHFHFVLPSELSFGYNGQPMADDTINSKSSQFVNELAQVARIALRRMGEKKLFVDDCSGINTAEPRICVQNRGQSRISITFSRPGEPLPPFENFTVIDMNQVPALH